MGFLRHGGSLSLHGFLITFGSLAMPWIEVISDFLARSVVRGFLRAAGSLTRPGVSDLILARSFRLVFTDFWARSRNNGFLMYSGSLLHGGFALGQGLARHFWFSLINWLAPVVWFTHGVGLAPEWWGFFDRHGSLGHTLGFCFAMARSPTLGFSYLRSSLMEAGISRLVWLARVEWIFLWVGLACRNLVFLLGLGSLIPWRFSHRQWLALRRWGFRVGRGFAHSHWASL